MKSSGLHQPEVQPPRRPVSVDSPIAHDQADPRARDAGIGEVDVFARQPLALATSVNGPSARAVAPLEQKIEPPAGGLRLGLSLLPLARRVVRDGPIGSATTGWTMALRRRRIRSDRRQWPRRRHSHHPRLPPVWRARRTPAPFDHQDGGRRGRRTDFGSAEPTSCREGRFRRKSFRARVGCSVPPLTRVYPR